MSRDYKLYIASGLCAIAMVAMFFIYGEPVETEAPAPVVPVFINPFATTSVVAKGVYVYSPTSTSTLYTHNEHLALPLASVTKIMTAYAASQVLKEDDTIIIQSEDLASEGDNGFAPGEGWKFSDLRDVMLTISSNDAAEAIRRATDEKLRAQGSTTTIEFMNQIAMENGLLTLKFESVSGLDHPDGRAASFGSARDISMLLLKILKERPEIFEATREPVIMRNAIGYPARSFKNTNVTTSDVPGLLASKTGFTDAAGGNLIIAFDAGLGSPVVIAILGSRDQDTRFDDMSELVSKSIRYINGTYK